MEGAGGLTVSYGEQSTVVTGTQALGGVPADAEVTIKWNDLPADTYLQNLSVGGGEGHGRGSSIYTFNMGSLRRPRSR